MSRRSTIDPDKLEFPSTIAPIVGLSANEITFLKKRGCVFLRTEDDRALGKRFRFRRAGRWQRNLLHACRASSTFKRSKSGAPVDSND